MYKFLSLLVAVILTSACFSQRFINKTKKDVSKIIKEAYTDKSIMTSIEQTDSTLHFLFRDPRFQKLTIQLHFDKRAKCNKERYLFIRDSCYNKFFIAVLNNERYHWVMVNEHTYFSLLPDKLIFSLEPRVSFAYNIERSDLSRRAYRKILNPKN